MGSQVPVWIPIIVALFGFAGVILTQALVGHREARRALDDTAREERRWHREREARTREARASAYAQLIGVIEAFDAVLFQARRVREAGIELDPIDAALLHLAIGPLELVSSARPEAPRQGSDARFVMILHGDCGACFAALSRGGDAL